MHRLLPPILAALLLVGCTAEPASPALPAFDIDPARVAVAGLSSGAYMATQVHLALNERIHGAAILSGGPYGCARGDLQTALDTCMVPKSAGPDPAVLAALARERATSGRIDPIAAFEGDRVWVFHGVRDTTVAPALGADVVAFYRALAPTLSVQADLDRPVGHVLATDQRGVDCIEGGSPWLGRCGFDAAAAAVAALFGTQPVDPALPAAGGGEVIEFDQRALFAADSAPQLADRGYLYVPPQCKSGRCGLLLAFHGCQQSAAQVGRSFVDDGGFNRAADAASLVVAYPQTQASWMPLNPKACWDWWGYTGADYDTREGAQIRFVDRLLDALLATPGSSGRP